VTTGRVQTEGQEVSILFPLETMQYPHWLMITGAVLVVVGIIGFAFRKNGPVSHVDPEQTVPTEEPISAQPEPRHQTEGQGKMTTAFSRVFALEVDGRPTLTFEASGTREAQQICKEPWLFDDLAALKSNGVPLCTVVSKLSVRRATPGETTIFEQVAESATPSDDMVLAYLVELDGVGKPL
jgi:hypothetical protein